MREVEATADVVAEPPDVFDVFSDVAAWPRWAGVKEVVIRQSGDPAPAGFGSIRVIRTRGSAIQEEVTAFEPPKRIAYQITEGAALRVHEADVHFEPSAAGTRVHWRMRFAPLIPFTGSLIGSALRSRMQDILQRLGRQF